MHGAGDVGYSVRAAVLGAGVHVVVGVGSRFSLCLTLVLEPDSNGFYFPVTPDNEWKVRQRNEKTNTYMPPAFATASRSSRDGCEFW